MDGMSRREFLAAAAALGISPLALDRLQLDRRTLDALLDPPRGERARPDSPGASSGPATAPAPIDDFFRDFAAEWVRADPSLATSSRYFSGDEQDRLEREVTPNRMPAWREDRIRLARDGLARLRVFDRSSFTDLQRVSARVMEWQLQTVVDEEKWVSFTFPIEQMNGSNVGLVEALTVRHPLLTERDAENYIAALGQVGSRMDEATDDARRLQERRFLLPDFIVAATLKQMRAFVATSPAENPFVSIFSDRIGAIEALPAARRDQLKAEAERVVTGQVYPAWRRAVDMLQAQGSLAKSDAGLWRLPGGDEAYAHFLRRFTTTGMTADEIHQLGLENVARIEGEMDGLLKGRGRTQGSVKDRIARLKLDLQYPDPRSDASRDQIMKDIDGIIRDAERRAALLFDRRPTSPVVARPFPTFREANAAANYNAPAADGSRPGTFQFPRRIENMTRFGLKSVVYHETVPGHHFQIALQVENKDLPRFRQIGAFGGISALTEGWGLYAERLAAESGWYGDDVEGRLGQLDYELFRARRLVVDTGLHAKRWTREQAIDYGIEASEVERYVVYPGQACSYMVGELELLGLRERAQGGLGGRFSLRGFHDRVLTTGTVPLEVMHDEIERWISSPG